MKLLYVIGDSNIYGDEQLNNLMQMLLKQFCRQTKDLIILV